jgi:hypothetical protein
MKGGKGRGQKERGEEGDGGGGQGGERDGGGRRSVERKGKRGYDSFKKPGFGNSAEKEVTYGSVYLHSSCSTGSENRREEPVTDVLSGRTSLPFSPGLGHGGR